jgi:hypothetical protein
MTHKPGNASQPPIGGALQILSIPVVMIAVALAIAIAAWGVRLENGWLGGAQGRPAAVYGFALVCTFLSLWLILGAVYAYLNVGQAKKIEIITGFYTPETIAEYFAAFWSGRREIRQLVANYQDPKADPLIKKGLETRLEAEFQAQFQDNFGLRVFVVPTILLTAVGGIALFFAYAGGIGLATELLDKRNPPVHPLGLTLDLVSVAALFGAYTWVTSDVIVRNHQWRLHPSDLAWYALRFVIAIPLGQALALTVGGDVTAAMAGVGGAKAGAFVAFVASMFSLDAITRTLATAATRLNMKLGSSDEERDDLIVKLAGVDEEKALALRMEGVSTIAQLMVVDPIRVSIRTGLSFGYILRLVDAALLWDFVGDKVKALRPLGLTGASKVLAMEEEWRRTDPFAARCAAYQQTFAKVSQAEAALQAAQSAPAADAAAEELLEARQAWGQAETALLALLAATPDRTAANADRVAMVTALTVPEPQGGPGLTAVGFDAIAFQLGRDSYAKFIRKLLS